MKKPITFTLVILFSFIFCGKTYAQRDAGGSADGNIDVPQPCPTAFSRNNGDGTCGGAAQIRLYFTEAPVFAPTLENILYNGDPLLTNGYPITGNVADLATKGYISYCLPTSNIPPAIKLTVIFKYANTGQEDCVLTGTN